MSSAKSWCAISPLAWPTTEEVDAVIDRWGVEPIGCSVGEPPDCDVVETLASEVVRVFGPVSTERQAALRRAAQEERRREIERQARRNRIAFACNVYWAEHDQRRLFGAKAVRAAQEERDRGHAEMRARKRAWMDKVDARRARAR